jgi:hypothetical protein
MSPFGKTAAPVFRALALTGVLFAWHQAGAEASPPPFIGEEMQRARTDFATGGVRKLSANWYSCVDRAHASLDANAAERCVVYGYSALLLSDSGASAGGMRHLTTDIVAPGQVELLQIMGIPAGPQQAWLERYRRWVAEGYKPERSFASGSGFTSDGAATPDRGFTSDNDYPPERGVTPFRGHASDRGDPLARDEGSERGATPFRSSPTDRGDITDRGVTPFRGHTPDSVEASDRGANPFKNYGPNRGDTPAGGFTQVSSVTPIRGFTPSFGPPISSDGPVQDGQIDFARAAAGQYAREAVRRPEIADALRNLVGQALFARLKDYTYGDPMQLNGRFAVGSACQPRDCRGSEARFVFSGEEVWVGIVDGSRLRIYGNPPRKVRALLLRDKNQVAWRGEVDDMSRPMPGPVVPASLEVAPRGDPSHGAPRIEVEPQRAEPDAAPRVAPAGDTTEIRLRRKGGTFDVPVTINDTVTMPFAIDSGSSDVSVSADVLEKLIQNGTVSRADFLGKQTYHLADGSRVSSDTFRIHSLKVGDREVRDVIGSVTNDADSLLLGQSFLTRFRSWSIDNQRGVLLLR